MPLIAQANVAPVWSEQAGVNWPEKSFIKGAKEQEGKYSTAASLLVK